MANATSKALGDSGATIRPEEAAHFGRMAADWFRQRLGG